MQQKTISFFKITTSLFLILSLFINQASMVFAQEAVAPEVVSSEQENAQSSVTSNTEDGNLEAKNISEEVAIQQDQKTEGTSDSKSTKDSTPDKDKKKDNTQERSLMSQQQDPASIPRSTTKQLLPDTDQSSGSLTYDLPIVVPPGRNGLQPDLKLSYNNQSTEEGAVFGSGWSVNIPIIERINRKGSEQIYSSNYFNSSLSGELVLVSGSTWAPKVENGNFITYTFSSNTWTAKAKNGTVYTFGSSSTGRQDDPGNGSTIYKWMLQEIRDTNDNYIKYTYYKNAGQIYPSQIIYTGHNTTDGVFEVNFLRQSRSDVINSFKTGFGVITNYRINEINTKIGNTLARKYALSYTNGGNGTRSILTSITESGYDINATTTTLPATSLSYQTQTVDWNSNTTWAAPSRFVHGISTPEATQIADVNGDGLLDFLFSGYEWDAGTSSFVTTSRVWLNNGSGYTLSGWTIPVLFQDNSYNDYGTRVVDVDGDGLADILFSGYEWDTSSNSYIWNNRVYVNTGSGWTLNNTWTIPIPFINCPGTCAKDNGTRIFDVNGDGLPDIIHAPWTGSTTTYLNTGSGWAPNTNWTMPSRFMSNSSQQQATDIADVNGDGLADVIFSGYEWVASSFVPTSHVWLNNGNGWTLDTSWSIPELFLDSGYNDVGTRIADVNGDGLADILFSGLEWDTGTNSYVWHKRVNINNGVGWEYDSSWNIPEQFVSCAGSCYKDTGVRIADLNGDGIPEIIKADYTGTPITYLNNSKKIDSLVQITSSQGSISTITYKPSTQYVSGGTLLNPDSPMVLETVSQISTADGFGNTSNSQYSYAGGDFYYGGPFDRKFAGFNKVTTTDPVGNVSKTFFHQGNSTDTSNGEYSDQYSKIGKIYRVEKYDNSNNLYSLNINKWDNYNIGTNQDFAKLVRETILQYDGTGTHTDTSTEYTYDNSFGSLLTKIEWGTVTGSSDGSFTDTGSDKRITTNEYAIGGTNDAIALKHMTLTDASSTKLKEDKYYYDTLSYGSIGNGNQTKLENWKVGSAYINSQKGYNGYGLITSETDPRGKVTSYSYDTYNLYPATVTDPLTNPTGYTYDYSSGKVATKTDPNSNVWSVTYDGLGRPLVEKIPDPAGGGTPLAKTTNVYTDTSGAVSVKTTQNLDGSNAVDSYKFFDGLGRLVQERVETESSYIAKDYGYYANSTLQKESLPYISSGTNRTSATGTTTLYINYTYDPLGRVLTNQNNIGTTTNSYVGFKTTVTDPRGKIKSYYTDAYGNLIQVDETNSGSTYITTYSRDLTGNLTNITDALSDVRTFTYDGLGRRLTAEDLHAPADTTYGSWSYTYDNAGNMTQSVSPEAKTVNYTYDDINRVLTENYTGASGTEITYTYDSCTNGIGKLCSVTMTSGANTTYTYDASGNIASESKTINGTTYTTSYTYDRQGNQLVITYPDSAQVRHTFNTAGLLDKVERKESGGSFSDVVSNIDYSPISTPTTIVYVNGVTTTNTYDATKLYRLTNRTSVNGSSIKLQDASYTYDANNNITQILDTSNTDSSKTVTYSYDDLNRLTSATATAVASGQSAYTQTYTYNAIGNITSGPVGAYVYGGTGTGLYANPHAATSINSVTNTYDKDGNNLTDGTLTNTWNYKQQLATSTNGTFTRTYKYDESGSRVSSSDGITTTVYPNKLYNYDGTKKTKSVYAGDQLVATVETVGATVTPRYVHTDHLNSTNVVSDASGAQVELLDYFPFGNQRISNGSHTDQRQFLGQIFDADTSLNYLNARYYDGKRGQFISQDPEFWVTSQDWLLDPQNQNSYAYARNNPINLSDPSGRSAISNAIQGIKNAWNNLFGNNKVNQPQVTTPTATQQPAVKTSTWDSVSNERIKQLDPRIQQPTINFINNTESELNTQLRVNEGYRSIERQDKLYNQSRTNPPTGPWATNAKGGQSYHNYGMAVDVVIMENGKPNWNKPISQDIANIGIKQGFEWGGNWAPPKTDYPHFQMTFGQSWQSLLKASK